MVKLIGCGLLLTSGVLRIFTFRAREKMAIRNLHEYIKLIEYVSAQIRYFSCPFAKILANCRSPLGKTPGEIKTLLCENMILGAEELQALNAWVCAMGNGYKNEQLNLCEYTKERLEQYLRTRENNYPGKAKTNSALTLLGVAALIVLLI